MKKETILIVDDMPSNIMALEKALDDANWDIKTAKSGEEALRSANEEPFPDLIILDVVMHDMDGYEVCRNLKNKPATGDIPVIFVTAKNNETDEEFGLSLGAVDYIHKPFSSVLVKARVKNHLIRYRMEKDLRLFSWAVQQSPAVIVITDLQGNIEFVNPKFTELTGYTFKEVEGENPRILKGGDKPPSEYKELWDTISSGREWHGEFLNKKKNGELFWENAVVSPIKNERGDILRYIAVKEDITERKRIETELLESREQYMLAVKGTNDGIWDWNIAENTLYLSPRWKEMIGYEDHEIPNEFYSFEERIHPEDKSVVDYYIDSYLKNEISCYSIEFRLRHKEGYYIWVLARGEALRDENGVPYRMAGSHTDITNRKLSEIELDDAHSRLLAILNSMENIIFVTDMETYEVLFINEAGRKMYGDVHGRKCWQVFQKDMTEPCSFCRNHELIKAEDIDGSARRWEQFDPETGRWTARRDHAIRWVGNRLVHMQVAIDITENKKIQNELTRAKEDAETGNRAKSEFLANMSHEIRTPLNGVIGFSELLMQTELSAVQSQYMNMVYNSANSLLDLINDILDFSKIEAGRLELNPEKSDIIEIIEHVSGIVSLNAREKGLEFLLNLPPDMPRYAHVDPVRLRQVFVNLLGNAVKFTDSGEIEFSVSFEKNSRNKETMDFYFSVRDTGIGISGEVRKKIFDTFHQADPSITKKYGGTGLGLPISNSLLENMGSRLELESEPGRGSRFFFKLALKYEHGESFASVDLSTLKKALIVDDNNNNRVIIKNMLAHLGIESSDFSSPLDALEDLKNFSEYDLIIVDYYMPELNGIDFVRRLREKPEFNSISTPLIVMSGSYDDNFIFEESDKLSVSRIIVKPVKLTGLHEALSDIVSGKKNVKGEKTVSSGTGTKPLDSKTVFRIMIVEDNKVNMMLAESIVSKLLPVSVISKAENGTEALKLYRDEKPDIVFMDIQMPGIDGYEVARRIRTFEGTSKRRVPLVALTAGTVAGERDRCLEAGMDDYISKPFSLETIKKSLEAWLSIGY